MNQEQKNETDHDIDGPVLDRLIERHKKFLNFLAARVENKETAEDILQSAYVKAIAHEAEIEDRESTVAWFYRILRNAVVDHYRRRAARTNAHASFAAEASSMYELPMEQIACACIGAVVRDLKAEYRDAIQKVDLEGASVAAFAEAEHLSAGNASVRLHRARKALAKNLTAVCGVCAVHKCLDCTCRATQL